MQQQLQLGFSALQEDNTTYDYVVTDQSKQPFLYNDWASYFRFKGEMEWLDNRTIAVLDMRGKNPSDRAAELNACVSSYKAKNRNQLPQIVITVLASADDLDCTEDAVLALYEQAKAPTGSRKPVVTPPPGPGGQDPNQVDPPKPDPLREAADGRFYKSWKQTLKSLWTYFNPTVGASFTGIAVVMGGLFAAFAPALLAAASPWLMGVAMVGAVYAAVTFVPYVIHECYQHFNAWRFDAWRNFRVEAPPAADAGPNAPAVYNKPNENATYADYLNALHNEAAAATMPGFGQYLATVGTSQLGGWISNNMKTSTFILLMLVASGFLLGGAVAFFMGNPLIAPVFNALSPFITGALQAIGTAVPGFGFLADLATMAQAVDIISTILMVTIPLVLANVVRLVARAENQAGLAAGSLPWYSPDDADENGYDPEGADLTANPNDELRASAAFDRAYGEFSTSCGDLWKKVQKNMTDGWRNLNATELNPMNPKSN